MPFAPGHYADLFALGALLLFWLSLALGADGGAEPLSAARAARFLALAGGVHLLVCAWRARDGFKYQLGALLFLPWLVWCAMDWAWFSPAPWEAENHFAWNCMAVAAFVISLYHFRDPALKWTILGGVSFFATAGAALSIGFQVRPLSWLQSEHSAAAEMGALSATLGHPVAAGAVLLLLFFPCLGYALGLRGNGIPRYLAIPASAIFLAGIFCTAHIGVIAGLFVGLCVVAFLFTRRWGVRALLVLLAFVALLLAAWMLDDNVGMNHADPAGANVITSADSPDLPEGGPSGPLPYFTKGASPVLVQAASAALSANPLQGLGTGGFRCFFEAVRPAGWELVPAGAGGLLATLLSESGLLGTALFIAPVLWVWISALMGCLALPRREAAVKAPGARRVPPVPHERLFLAAAVAGSAGAGVALVVDYPGPMPAVACLFAILGGAMLRHTHAAFPLVVSGSKLRELVLLLCSVVLPIGWLFWARTSFKAYAHSRAAAVALAPLLPENGASGSRTVAEREAFGALEVRGRLDFAEENALAAIQFNPRDGPAWNTLAAVALRRFLEEPARGAELSAAAVSASKNAVLLAPDNFEFRLTHAFALSMSGEHRLAENEFGVAHALAPGSVVAALAHANAVAAEGGGARISRALAILREAAARHPDNLAIRARLNLLRTGAGKDATAPKPE
ncbi:MAG: hypothetical protein LBG65_08730 [Puniceicoccales bacterium]|nr:hypothetical protein [Puniceicoccales bacterium]